MKNFDIYSGVLPTDALRVSLPLTHQRDLSAENELIEWLRDDLEEGGELAEIAYLINEGWASLALYSIRSHRPDALPQSSGSAWIKFVLDGVHGKSAGPTAFHVDFVERLFGNSSFVGIVGPEPIHDIFHVAAKWTCPGRHNCTIVSTSPSHFTGWIETARQFTRCGVPIIAADEGEAGPSKS